MNNQYADEEKRAAFEWLRRYALNNKNGFEHAICLLTEIVNVKNENVSLQETIEIMKCVIADKDKIIRETGYVIRNAVQRHLY